MMTAHIVMYSEYTVNSCDNLYIDLYDERVDLDQEVYVIGQLELKSFPLSQFRTKS